MNPRRNVRPTWRWLRRTLPVWLGVVLLAGCFDEPKIEDRWTRVDIDSSSLAPFQTLSAGARESVTVRTRVTFRRILTGYAVVELRASSIPTSAVVLHPDAPRVAMATGIDSILNNSVSLGRATRAVTGWDHLIQNLTLGFSATVPATANGLYLLCYLADGQKIERGDGTDTLIVTPYMSTPNEILPVGMELAIGP